MTLPSPIFRALRNIIYPLIPIRHRLAFTYWVYRFAGRVEPELLNIHIITSQHSVAIDVGANIGLWSYGLSRLFSQVHSFEANKDIAADLQSSSKSNIHLEICGLSSQEGEATLYIPLQGEIRLTGWASLRRGNCPDTSVHIEKKVQLKTLDSFKIQGVSFIKIDTEGHELEVLRGATETIVSNQPLLLIEVMERNHNEILSYFRQINYEELTLQNPSHFEQLLTMRLYGPKATCI